MIFDFWSSFDFVVNFSRAILDEVIGIRGYRLNPKPLPYNLLPITFSMPKFQYTGRNRQNEAIEGTLEAETEAAAADLCLSED